MCFIDGLGETPRVGRWEVHFPRPSPEPWEVERRHWEEERHATSGRGQRDASERRGSTFKIIQIQRWFAQPSFK